MVPRQIQAMDIPWLATQCEKHSQLEFFFFLLTIYSAENTFSTKWKNLFNRTVTATKQFEN